MFAPNAPIRVQMVDGQPVAQLTGPVDAQGNPQTAQVGQAGAPAQIAGSKDSPIDVSRIDGQVRDSSIKKVGEVVGAHPEEALAIIRTWLHQPV
jgi:flagellar M-ring protein FliF